MIDCVDLVGEGVRIRRRGKKSIYLIISEVLNAHRA